MNWIGLESQGDLKKLIERSYNRPQVIYKHSTSCGRCLMVKKRLEKSKTSEDIDFNYLDLWEHRDLSNQIATDFGIRHESPQVILLVKGKPVYHAAHWRIHMKNIVTAAEIEETKQ